MPDNQKNSSSLKIQRPLRGFTLIELSIVLVVIGLLVGGVLVGRDLVRATEVRAQISQIEKYQQAVNTFRGKYEYLPGDIPSGPAIQFGFAARGSYAGEGDGNGVIEGIWQNWVGSNTGIATMGGETAMFWKDLSAASLIPGSFTLASPTANLGALSTTGIAALFPLGMLGTSNYVYVYSWFGPNFFGLSAVNGSFSSNTFYNSSGTSLTVQQAYVMDAKVDDGLPQSGVVMAIYIAGNLSTGQRVWAAGGGNQGASGTSATAASSTTCFDNGNVAGATQQYSIAQNNGAGMNCALSFKFQ